MKSVVSSQFLRVLVLAVALACAAQLTTEANVIKLRGAQRTNRVRLYQALDGSFDAAPPTLTSVRQTLPDK